MARQARRLLLRARARAFSRGDEHTVAAIEEARALIDELEAMLESEPDHEVTP